MSKLETTLPLKGRLLGIDPGKVRVGIAVCDYDRIMASPLETYTRKSAIDDSSFWKKLVKLEQVVGLVVGLPIHMNGDEGVQAEEARKFGAWLTEITGLPVDYQDERCTSSAAEDLLLSAGMTNQRRKARRDQLAAQMILQSYMDRQSRPATVAIDSPDDS